MFPNLAPTSPLNLWAAAMFGLPAVVVASFWEAAFQANPFLAMTGVAAPSK